MTEKTCAFTGHRVIAISRRAEIEKRLEEVLSSLIDKGVTTFIAGGALGFDTLAEKAVLKLKKAYPHIKLRLILPCPEQDVKWREQDKAVYRDMLDMADSTEYVSDRYTDSCMLDRNRKMVDEADALVAFYDGRKRSGTAMTVNYAAKKGIPIINLF